MFMFIVFDVYREICEEHIFSFSNDKVLLYSISISEI